MKKIVNLAYTIFMLIFTFTLIHAQQSHKNFGELNDYNVFVINDAKLSSADAQGRIAVGSKAEFSDGFSIGDQLTLSSPAINVLIVGTDLTYSNGVVYNGNVVYGESADVNSLDIPNGELLQGEPLDFSDLALKAAEISLQWKAIEANGTTSFTNGKITLTGTNSKLNVFWLDGDNLSSANNLEVIVPAGATVLVNVSAEEISWSGGLTLLGANQTKVIYNFYESSKLTLTGIEIKGSVLAPFAEVNFNSGVIYGSTIAYNLSGSGQYNNSLFDGSVEYTPSKVGSECTVSIRQILTGKSFRVSPAFLGHSSLWAGTFLGYVNDHSTTFYCVDISRWLRFKKPYEFDKVISGKINYIVNNHYPKVEHTGENGQLANKREEAASVQAAIWHFSDGFNPENISNNNRIKARALAIIEEAKDKNTSSIVTFEIRPSDIMLMEGAAATFTVLMKDDEGTPIADAEVNLSADGGIVSPESGKTDDSGALVFTVKQSGGENSIKVTAESFEAVLPPASRYKYPNAQTLVTNYPVVTCLTAEATAYWTDDPLPGSAYSFYSYTSQNSSIPENYTTDISAGTESVIAAFRSKGIGIFNRQDESWEIFNADNVSELKTNSFTKIFKFKSGEFKDDWAAGSQSEGFFLYDVSKNEFKQFSKGTTSGGFSGSSINGFDYYKKSGKEYLLVAHDAGLSKYNLTGDEFTNYNTSNLNFPGGNTRAVHVDNDNGIWVGTDYGLAYSSDEGDTWTVYSKDNTIMTGNIITCVEDNGNSIYVGTWNSGLYRFDKSTGDWKNLSPFISAQPITALHFEDDKLFIGNYDHGVYVYDGENFIQYPSVNDKGSPDIVNSISYDGNDLWFATQSGLARTTNGVKGSSGSASVTIEDKTIHIGGTTTLAVKLHPKEDIEYYRLSGTIVYNQSELKYEGDSYGELFSGWKVYKDTKTEGRINFRAVGDDAIKKEGSLFYLSFKAKEDLPGDGLSAIYATSFKSGLDNELEHSDLGIVTYTTSGTADGGRGDANLDGEIDISDLLAISNSITYGGDYELKDNAAKNADVDEDDDVDTEDQSDLLAYLQTGVFPNHDGEDANDGGSVGSDDLEFDKDDGDDDENDDGSVIVPVNLSGGQNVSSVQVSVNYDPDQINFASFSSDQISSGNFVSANQPEPGKTILNFAAPASSNGSFNIGKLVFNLGNNALGNSVITTSYSINAGASQSGPSILITSNGDVKPVTPDKFGLAQNYPNPFNPSTVITAYVPESSVIELSVYNILGQKVAELFKGFKPAGVYLFTWNANSFGTGIYFYRMKAGNKIFTKKMALIK